MSGIGTSDYTQMTSQCKLQPILISGRPHTTEITFCECEEESATLVRHHLWPSTPNKPQVAFHFHLLEWWRAFQLEAQVSTSTFCHALKLMNGGIANKMVI